MLTYYNEITQGALLLYMLLLLVAAVTDIWKFIIPNLVSIALLALFVALALLQPFPVNWWSHLGAGAAFFAIGLLLYRFNFLGAGDVKLITVLSVWAGFEHVLDMLLGIALCGGALALLLILIRKLVFSFALLAPSSGRQLMPRVLLQGEPVPYGVGIAAGGIWLGMKLPLLGYGAIAF
jgi:prepilin peptidase CpaA